MKFTNRIFPALLLFFVLLTAGCAPSGDAEKRLDAEIQNKAATYTRPSDMSAEDWKDEAVLRAKKELAESRSTPPEYLSILARDDSSNIRTRVAKNPNTPIIVLERFGRSDEEIIRNYLAANIALPQELLDRLSRDGSPIVRQAAAANPKNSSQNFQLLAADPDSNVQSFLARNRSLSTADMLVMVEKSQSGTLEILLKRANLPPAVVEKLKAHSDPKIQEKARVYTPAVQE